MSQTHSIPSDEATVPKRPLGNKNQVPRLKREVDTSSELAYGQSVIVIARWILVVAGLCLILWNPNALSSLRIEVGVVILLALMNFYLQAQILMGRKMLHSVVIAASVVDFLVITALVWLGNGFESNTFVFYFPALLAIAVAFETGLTVTFVGIVVTLYGLICLGTGAMVDDNFSILIIRAIMLVGVAFCGNLFWHIEQDRRNAATQAHQALLAEIERSKSSQLDELLQEVDYASAS